MKRERMPTGKQARFVAEYLKDLNGSEAAVRAGYTPLSSRHTASRLLAKPHIKAEVERLQAAHLGKVGVTAESVLEQLRRIAFFDVGTIYETPSEGPSLPQAGAMPIHRLKHPTEWPADARAALASYDTLVQNLTAGDGLVDQVIKVKLEPKLAALELLAKHLGLLTDRTQVDQTVTIQWLPPEPPPPLPVVETIDAMGPSQAVNAGMEPLHVREKEMGFARAPGGPPDRTHPSRFSEFSDPQGEHTSSVDRDEELERAMETSGISRRAQERMFPELRKTK